MSEGISIKRHAEAEVARISVRNVAVISAQLVLVLLLFRQFQIESAAFLRLSVLVFAGFIIHAFLPLRYRLPFFLALSLTGIAMVLGVGNGIWLVSIGMVLIGVCHLPMSFASKGAILAVLGVVLAAQRVEWLPAIWSQAIWPVLGSMFMFRLILYFYELRHDKTPASLTQTLAYFFMLPNACFPLFPVVDYRTFRRNYYDDDAYRIYQVGVDWMVRGVIHLILYRVIYYHLTLAPVEVTEPAALMQYLVTNFLLYLRVSGLFHLIVGMLYLFGFRLPETHNRYLLASSFTDFWRRINIYWKDFMQKVFYYPAVFRLRTYGMTSAVVLATVYVFFMTWLLHSYQWFWLRGSMLLVTQDVLFWAVLGGVVAVNAAYELAHGRQRTLGTPARTWSSIAAVVVKTYATFWFICILWSFWTTESVADWLSLWGALRGGYGWDVLLYPGLVLGVIVLGSLPRDELRNVRGADRPRTQWLRARAVTGVSMVALVVVSMEGVSLKLGPEVATFVQSLRSGQLSRLDTAKLERGYYESLLSVNRFNSQLWEVYMKKPATWLDQEHAHLKRFVGGFAQVELIPSFVSNSKYGTITINRFGMRDKEYDVTASEGTFRAAVLGPSNVMGWGVSDGQTFEALVEERLNRERANVPFKRYELLNLGVPGYDAPQQLVSLEKAFGFTPNAILYVATGREMQRATRYLVTATQKRLEIPYEPLRQIIDRAEVRPDMDEATALQRMTPYRSAILAYVYAQIVERTREQGALPVWIFLPAVEQGKQQDTEETRSIAEAAGFLIIDLEDVYQGRDVSSLWLAEWDHHPNVEGHRIIADRLYTELIARREQIFRPID